MIDLSDKALRRRAFELAKAADEVSDGSSRALLLFYSAECGLKAIYMRRNSLKSTESSNAARSASSFSHRLDDLIVILRLPAATVAPRPADLTVKGAPQPAAVGELNQIWRYGGALAAHDAVVNWLERIVTYLKKELT